MTLPVLESDPAEQVLLDIESATGCKPVGCPWRALRDPYVYEVSKNHRAFTKGELAPRRGARTPAALIWGVETLDQALNAIEVANLKADRAEREKQRDPEPTRPRPKGRLRR